MVSTHVSQLASQRVCVLRETHIAPASLQHRIACAGGLNRFGEPNFRVVWGWSRLTWIGGKWTDTDAHGNVTREIVELREVPKYLPLDRWHIERWMPPETYSSPRQWYAQTVERENGVSIPALGPYPSRGEYEHCFTLQGPCGEFISLSPAACESIVRAVEFARARPSAEHRAAVAHRENRRENEWESQADAIVSDASPAFHGAPFIATL
ncbi:MAG TPA: hypothetical protein VKB26_01850 [Candidatus Acidoferrales bacterium]|nr:hypothetical protein [Candidatus Acidoferrales bacterium]